MVFQARVCLVLKNIRHERALQNVFGTRIRLSLSGYFLPDGFIEGWEVSAKVADRIKPRALRH